jgi:hypothetical protein
MRDEPVRKKPKRKRQAPAWRPPRRLVVVLAVVLLVGLVAFLVIRKLTDTGPRAVAPSAFATYKAPEGAFQCQYPEDWSVQPEGIHNRYKVTFTKHHASIRISQGVLGSVLADISGALGAGKDDERSPVAQVHELKRRATEAEASGYKEEPAQTVTTRFGKARRSAFTEAGSFGKQTRGYRATVLGHQTQFDVYCECPAADWETLQPAFAQVIESLGPGTGP